MNATLQTERLTLRPVRAQDWPAIQRIWEDQKQSPLAQYDKPNDTGDAAVQARIARWAAACTGGAHIFYAVCRKETVIGYFSFNAREDGYELGYCFHSAYHGHGYAREALSALLQCFARSGHRRFTAGTALNNTPSVRLLLSQGFRQTGAEQVSFYQDPQGRDIVFEGGLFALEL